MTRQRYGSAMGFLAVAAIVGGCAGTTRPSAPSGQPAAAAPPRAEATPPPPPPPPPAAEPAGADAAPKSKYAPIVSGEEPTPAPAQRPTLPSWWFDGPRFEGDNKERVRIATFGEAATVSQARRHALDAGRDSVKSLLGREPRQVTTERVWTTTSEHGFRVYVLTMGE